MKARRRRNKNGGGTRNVAIRPMALTSAATRGESHTAGHRKCVASWRGGKSVSQCSACIAASGNATPPLSRRASGHACLLADGGAGWNGHSGTVQERFQYDPYGQAKVLDANFADDGDGASDVDWEYRFTGRSLDVDTGLDYYRARYYHPTLGRFVGRDPIGYEAGDANLYRYVGDSPINKTDPSGEGCKVTFACTLNTPTAAPPCSTDCLYTCTDTRRDLTGGGTATCDAIKAKPGTFTVMKGTTKTSRYCMWWNATIGQLPYCPNVSASPTCPLASAEVINFYAEGSGFDRNCSLIACHSSCQTGIGVDKFCGTIKNPSARTICYLTFQAGGVICKDFCNALCNK